MLILLSPKPLYVFSSDEYCLWILHSAHEGITLGTSFHSFPTHWNISQEKNQMLKVINRNSSLLPSFTIFFLAKNYIFKHLWKFFEGRDTYLLLKTILSLSRLWRAHRAVSSTLSVRHTNLKSRDLECIVHLKKNIIW